MVARRNPETEIQIAVFDHIRVRGIPGAHYWHTPNGGYRTKSEAARFKRMGVMPGVSDVLAFHDGRLFCLELKAPGGRAGEDQLAFISDMDRAGAFTALVEGLDPALATLESWGLIRPALTMADVLHRAEQRGKAVVR